MTELCELSDRLTPSDTKIANWSAEGLEQVDEVFDPVKVLIVGVERLPVPSIRERFDGFHEPLQSALALIARAGCQSTA